jgi:large subunit ribosomal protein L10
MAVTREQKKEILAGLVDQFSRSKSVIFADYRGLTVSGISELRKRLREKDAECKVAKKTLMRLAAKKNNLPDLADNIMEGPVAATFSYKDELSGLQVLFKFSKENENLKLLGGIIDGKSVGVEEIKKLAKLPSKNELYAKLLGSMNAPVTGFVGILSNLLGGFVRVVNAYKNTLPPEVKEVPKAPEAPEAPKTPEVAKAPEAPVAGTPDAPKA